MRPIRDIMDIGDIEGSKSRARSHTRLTSYSNLDYRDVTSKHWESMRRTNPLMPVYKVRDSVQEGDWMKITKTGLNASYGHIEGNVPCTLPNPISGVRNLETHDIRGAHADTKRVGPFTHYKRRAD